MYVMETDNLSGKKRKLCSVCHALKKIKVCKLTFVCLFVCLFVWDRDLQQEGKGWVGEGVGLHCFGTANWFCPLNSLTVNVGKKN